MAPKKHYTSEQMSNAVAAVRDNGAKISAAAKEFGVPRITLYNKLSGKSPMQCNMGPSTVLTNTEEDMLVKWMIALAERRFPITKDHLLDSVQRIVTDENRSTPFTGNRPGKKWFASFLKRHPILAQRTAENLSSARNEVTEDQIIRWFREVEEYLTEECLLEILQHPSRIFNADESAFFLSPKPGRVLVKRGEKHVYSASGDEKENLTVLVTGNAAGSLAPPMIVFAYARIPVNIANSVPDDWAIGKSESGWMCSDTFYEYVTSVFNPWLVKMNIQKPVLFFLDGHKSHLTLNLSNFCSANGIEIIALYPNSTHILQPMDIAVFKPLKQYFRKEVMQWKTENMGQKLKKEDFAPVFKKALEQITEDCIKNGFRGGGLYPYGPEYVDLSKIKKRNQEPNEQTEQEKSRFLSFLESQIAKTFGQDKLDMYNKLYYEGRNVLENMALDEDMNLYVIWAHTKQMTTSSSALDPRTQKQGLSQNVEVTAVNSAIPALPHVELEQHEIEGDVSAHLFKTTDITDGNATSTGLDLYTQRKGLSHIHSVTPALSNMELEQHEIEGDVSAHLFEIADFPNDIATSTGLDLYTQPQGLSQNDDAIFDHIHSVTPPLSNVELEGFETERNKSVTTDKQNLESAKSRKTLEQRNNAQSTNILENLLPATCHIRLEEDVPKNDTAGVANDSGDHRIETPKGADFGEVTVIDQDTTSAWQHLELEKAADSELTTETSEVSLTSPTLSKTSIISPNLTSKTVDMSSCPSTSKQDPCPFVITTSNNTELHPNKSGYTPQKDEISKSLGVTVPSPFKRYLFWPDSISTKKNYRKKEKIPSAATSSAWREYHEKKEADKKRLLDEKDRKAKERQEKKILKEKQAEEKKSRMKGKRKNVCRMSSSEDTDVEINYAESGESEYDEHSDSNVYDKEMIDKQNIPNKKLVKASIQTGPRKRKRQTAVESGSESDLPLAQVANSGKVSNKENSIGNGYYIIVKYEGEYFPGVVKNKDERKNSYEISTMVLSTGNTFRWPERPDIIWYNISDIIEVVNPPVKHNNRGFFKVPEMDKFLPNIYI